MSTKIIEAETYDGINACHLCIVASGTATLETAILEKPMVIVYKTSFSTWLMAKLLVKIPHIGLVNVVAGKKIVPECVQFQATPEHIVSELRKIITDEIRIAVIKENLRDVKNLLGHLGQVSEPQKSFTNPLPQPTLQTILPACK